MTRAPKLRAHSLRSMIVAAAVAAFTMARADAQEVTAGRYEGTAFNTTFQKRGKAVLEIVTVRAGTVHAHFVASEGLGGEAWLRGRLAGGVLELSGPLSALKMIVHATMQPGGRITGDYELSGQSPQAGRIDVVLRGPASAVIADGDPPLTADMAARFVDLCDHVLELRLDAGARRRLIEVLAGAWRRDDRAVIDDVLGDLASTSGQSLEQVSARRGPDAQPMLVERARRNASRSVMDSALVVAFDRVHPDRIAPTRARGFADLVGTWSRGDALAPQRMGPGALPTGIWFSEASTLEIGADHRFTRAHFHEQCEGTGSVRCCRQYRLAWRGTVDVEGALLVFRIAAGVESLTDSCHRGQPLHHEIAPHVERAGWWVRPRPPGDAFALCWNDRPGQPMCYGKK
jgi:hypothetical protein